MIPMKTPFEILSLLPQLVSFGGGILSGVIISIPITGPMGVYITVQGLKGQVFRGVITAVGTAVVETIYCFLAFLGVSYLAGWQPIMDVLYFGGALLIIVLGIQQYGTKEMCVEMKLPYLLSNSIGGFLLGVVITAINPGVILSWVVILALLTEYGFSFAYPSDMIFSIGVGAGSVVWFYIYLLWLQRVRSQIKPQWLNRLLRILSVVLIGAGLFLLSSRLFALMTIV